VVDIPLIQIRNITKEFKVGNGSVTAIHNVNFDVAAGSFTIIYGPSGSGKSTLLNTLMGLNPPTSGTVLYDGQDLYTMQPNQRAFFRAHTMGIVQQSNNWVRSLNVIENVALPLRFIGMPAEAALQEAYNSLKRIGIESYAHTYPQVLSGGEQQRAAMARALVNNPSYIVADEPTGNLDSKNSDALITLLRYLNKDFKRTIILVTHNLEYLSIGDQLILMEDGEISEMKNAAMHTVTDRLLEDMRKRITRWSEV